MSIFIFDKLFDKKKRLKIHHQESKLASSPMDAFTIRERFTARVSVITVLTSLITLGHLVFAWRFVRKTAWDCGQLKASL